MATDDNVVSDPKDETSDVKNQTGEIAESKNGAVNATTSNEQKTEVSKTSEQGDDNSTNELKEQLLQAEKKAAENWEEVLRARADLENTRKRMERDIENAHKYAVEKFVQGLLPVIDSLEMGLAVANQQDANIASVKEGTELTLKMFSDCVNKFGMQSIDPKGERFNPEYHQAMSIQESGDHEPDTVIAVMQKGYLLNGRLVRPAMVVVSKSASKSATHDRDNAGEGEKPDKNS